MTILQSDLTTSSEQEAQYEQDRQLNTQLYITIEDLLSSPEHLTQESVHQALSTYGAGVTSQKNDTSYSHEELVVFLGQAKSDLGKVDMTQVIEARQSRTAQAASSAIEIDTENVDYSELANQLITFQSEGKTSSEICTFLTTSSLKLTAWGNPSSFPGGTVTAFPPLPDDQQGRLQNLLTALGAPDHSVANGPSDTQPQFGLQNYIHLILGEKNMEQVDKELYRIKDEYNALPDESERKKYAESLLGITIEVDKHGRWNNLPGLRCDDGRFGYSDTICVSGSLGGDSVCRLWVDRDDAHVDLSYARNARLSLSV